MICSMRKMTNSAGRTIATPISQISRPFWMSSSVIVVSSQRTKNASSGFRPKSAPARHCVWRNALTLSTTHPMLADEPMSSEAVVDLFLHGVGERG